MKPLVAMRLLVHRMMPLCYAKSMADLIQINVIVSDFRKAGDVFRLIVMAVLNGLIIICGLNVNFATKFHPLIRNSMGEIAERIFSAYSIGFIELMIIRCWLLFIDKGKGRIESIRLITLVNEMDDVITKSLMKYVRFGSLSLYLTSLAASESIMLFQLITLDLKLDDRLIRVAWVIGVILVVQFSVPDLPIIYFLIFASVLVVRDKINKFISSLRDFDGEKDDPSSLALEYTNLVKIMRKANSFIYFVINVGKFLAIPFFSLVIVAYLTPVSRVYYTTAKYMATLAATIHVVRIYIVICYLARMHTLSNEIHTLCAEKIVRERSTQRLLLVKVLSRIMDDIAGGRSVLLFDELSGKIVPFVLLESVISTFTFLILFSSFDL